MGGTDKAMVMLAGQPLLAHVIARLAGQVATLALSANGDAARFGRFGLPVLPDPPGFLGEGPLAGVLAGLGWAQGQGARALVTVSVDTPFLPRDLVARLKAAAGTGLAGTGAAMATSGGRLHPTVALWPLTARTALAEALASGERRLRVVLAEAVTVAFDAAPLDPFFNVNTPDDLARAETLCRAGAP